VGDFPERDIAKGMKLTGTEVERLSLEIQGQVARITLRNPPLNIIDLTMMDELASALAEIEAQLEISIVVFRGEGNCFSAGVDVAVHTPDKIAFMLEKFHRVIRSLISTTTVIIAAVQGHCLGGGAELAMLCDLVYTTEDAQWGFPEIQLGCFPPVAATALSALIGQKRASDLILTGRTITGVEAAAIGLATGALAKTQLENSVDETINRLSALSSATLALTKKAIYAWDSTHFDKGLARAEKIYLDELMNTEDANEGIRAFMEKRQPKWKGR
jgi:cyclohexa-1,5-dienecarbonyl-CoA hydratase